MGAIPNSGVPDSVQDLRNVPGQRSSHRPPAEHLKNLHVHWKQGGVCSFLQSWHRRLAAWQSRHILAGSCTSSGPFQEASGILWSSASLCGPGSAALHCKQDCALGVGSMKCYSVLPGASLSSYNFSVPTPVCQLPLSSSPFDYFFIIF